jgi:phosphatidylethanolamine-binding protein
MNMFKIKLNDAIIENETILSFDSTQYKPRIKFTRDLNQLYTVIMIDPDAPRADDPIYRYHLHWLVINTNTEAVEFKPPNPPVGTGKHRYFIYLYKQSNKINPDSLSYIKKRSNFDLDSFVSSNSLEEIAHMYFMTEKVKD